MAFIADEIIASRITFDVPSNLAGATSPNIDSVTGTGELSFNDPVNGGPILLSTLIGGVGESNTLSNAGVGGISVVAVPSKVGVALQAKSISGTAQITVIDDVVNNKIDIALGVVNLPDMADVTIAAPAVSEVLTYNGANWANAPVVAPPLPSYANSAAAGAGVAGQQGFFLNLGVAGQPGYSDGANWRRTDTNNLIP